MHRTSPFSIQWGGPATLAAALRFDFNRMYEVPLLEATSPFLHPVSPVTHSHGRLSSLLFLLSFHSSSAGRTFSRARWSLPRSLSSLFLSLPLVSRLLKRNGSITSPNGNQGNEAAAHHQPANPLSVDSVGFIFSVNRNPRSVRDGRWLGPSFPSLTISSSFPCLSAHRQRRTVCCLHRVHPSPIHRRRRRRRHHHSHRMRNRLCIFGRKIPLSAEYSAVSTCVARSLG